MKSIYILFIIFYSNISYSQACFEGSAAMDLNINHIRPRFRLGGDMFWDGTNPKFIIDEIVSGKPEVSTIFAADLWMTGVDTKNERKLSVQTYRNVELSYVPYGDNQTECNNWNKMWTVYGSDINYHILQWNLYHKIDNKKDGIYAWPGKGNPFFFSKNNFSLPTDINELAPFYDLNNDGIYNPDDGDYPALFDIKTGNVVVPDQILWYMTNDDAINNNTLVKPLNMLVQITAWAWAANDPLINNTIFTKHTLIYRGNETLKDFKTAMFIDFDLGCGSDDYIGCNKDLSTMFVYNSDSIDGSPGTSCGGTNTFGDDPGVQSATFLSDSLKSFIYGANLSSGYPSQMNHPTSYSEFLNYMDTKYRDGKHLLNTGYGLTGNETEFAFDGNPNNLNEWSMMSSNLMAADLFGLGIIYFGELNPGMIKSFTTAYSFFNNPTLKSTASDLDSMYTGLIRLRNLYKGFFKPYANISSTSEFNVKNFYIFPNPAENQLTIRSEKDKISFVTLFDLYGRIISKSIIDNIEGFIDVSSIENGTYIVDIHFDDISITKKIIIMH